MANDFGVNAGLVSELVGMYLHDRNSVDQQWRAYLDALIGGGEAGARPPAREPSEASPSAPRAPTNGDASALVPAYTPPPSAASFRPTTGDKEHGIAALINGYRVRGHLLAELDPLGLLAVEAPPAMKDFALSTFGLSDEDLDQLFSTGDLPGPGRATLREIVERLRDTYCRSVGAEFRDVEDPAERAWLQARMEETRNRVALSRAEQRHMLVKLTEAESFETFIHKNFLGAKRFSLQGAESLIPLLDELIERAGDLGCEEIVLGMAHRGRLNVLANVMDKPVREIFAQFKDDQPLAHLGSGDVKYHLGASTDRTTKKGAKLHLTLAFNPSHLEFVNPVVEGRVRAKQDRKSDRERNRVMPLLIHGDAAFIGQGVNAETLNLANLEGYSTGGSIHVIVNNQVGFTTLPRDSRSTRYATDLARLLRVPVFHVNGEDLEAVAHVARLAAEYRQKFGREVVIDLYCYRRYGHNEGDEPRFTQPAMYAVIDKKPTIREIYVRRLLADAAIAQADVDTISREVNQSLADALDLVKRTEVSWVPHAMGGLWIAYRGGRDAGVPEASTAVAVDKLVDLSKRLLRIPEGFHANPKVLGILQPRAKKLEAGEGVDWGTGEALAFASLLDEGVPVRLSGQDARRGTFAHRHAVLFDGQTGQRHSPLQHLSLTQGRFEVWDSPLSETGVLGFDYGYSLDYPDALVIWEAQFGDFANGAQVIIDQFISSAEDKWRRLSGIVLLLPHGYEGQGPEHSYARLDRFLALCAEDNIQVVNPTTPAQIFHVLRRQVHRSWRKPLIVMTPKSLLRAPAATSTIGEFADGAFQRVIPDSGGADPAKVTKVLLCSGKLYYDLADARKKRGRDDVAIVRLEQLYPLDASLDRALAPFRDGIELKWVQEEPLNMGAWFFVNAHLGDAFRKRFQFSCATREESASPATGSKASHDVEQARLIERAFAGG
jgi:2-oxoglutarate dehydrogenase E1 component